jgi:hypothetical protein
VVALPAQGEIWWAEAEDKRRPVLVVTRTEAVTVLTGIVVAPVTRTVRNIPTEVRLGDREPDRRVRSFLRQPATDSQVGTRGTNGQPRPSQRGDLQLTQSPRRLLVVLPITTSV